MYRAVVFFDLDGTLYADDKTLPACNLSAIKRLRANGVLPAITTGRDLWEIDTLMAVTKISTIVAGNGATVRFNNHTVGQHYIPATTVTRITAAARRDRITTAYYNEHHAVLSGTDDLTQANYAEVQQAVPVVNPDFDPATPVTRMLLFIGNDEAGNRVKSAYQQEFPEMAFYRDSPYDVDTISKDTSKASGIAELLEQPDLHGVPTYAFGDADNDLPLLAAVDHPVAMQNGTHKARHSAEFVTADNMHKGIPKGLRHFGLI